jgi:hypothetical protein
VPAFAVSGDTGGIFRVFAGPVFLAVLLHFLLGLEVRMSGTQTAGIVGQALREARERLTAYLGIGRRGSDSAAIARSRATDRAVSLAVKVAGTREGTRRHRARSARLAKAMDRAVHGLSGIAAQAADAEIVSRVVRRKSVADLARISLTHDWTESISGRKADDALIVDQTETPASPASESSLLERDWTESISGRITGDALIVDQTETPASPASESSLLEDDAEYTSLTLNCAELLAHEPPSWSSLSLREAVAKADAILPDLSSPMLSLTLREVGIETSPASIRSTRSALRRAAKEEVEK